eukprot:3752955-Rhodomonas_salina.4
MGQNQASCIGAAGMSSAQGHQLELQQDFSQKAAAAGIIRIRSARADGIYLQETHRLGVKCGMCSACEDLRSCAFFGKCVEIIITRSRGCCTSSKKMTDGATVLA